MRTWHIETAVVTIVLVAVALLSGGKVVDWIVSAAVLCTFGHASVSDRLAEREAAKPVADVDCSKWATRYWVAKELLWLASFIALKSWPALASCILFLVYPFWRKAFRSIHPIRNV